MHIGISFKEAMLRLVVNDIKRIGAQHSESSIDGRNQVCPKAESRFVHPAKRYPLSEVNGWLLH